MTQPCQRSQVADVGHVYEAQVLQALQRRDGFEVCVRVSGDDEGAQVRVPRYGRERHVVAMPHSESSYAGTIAACRH